MAGVSLGEEKHDLNEVESEETIRIDGHHVFDRFLDAARSRNWNDWQDHHRTNISLQLTILFLEVLGQELIYVCYCREE